MKRIEIEFTDKEHDKLAAVALREHLHLEEWVTLAVLGVAATYGARVGPSSPRRNPRSRTPQKWAQSPPAVMVRCPNCHVMTRGNVSTCDNCEVLL